MKPHIFLSLLATVSALGTFDKIKRDAVFNDVFQVRIAEPADDECPPCFNCNLPNFECTQFSQCNNFTGMCECRDGYGGMDCSVPLCGSLEEDNNRRPKRPEDKKLCKCKEGWEGVNCNLCTTDAVCDSFVPEGLKGTCYKTGIIVNKFHQMCDVTNKKIVSILNGKKPQATFSCNKTAGVCDFQFWIDQKESFYCELDKCKLDYDLAGNTTHYNCENVACKCLPDRMLCGEAGSIDISEFLTETIRGPGDFTCDVGKSECRFSEPSMNDLISSVFGDPYITLKCKSGECVHKSEIPGYDIPGRKRYTLGNQLVFAGVIAGCLFAVAAVVMNIRKSPLFKGYSAVNESFNAENSVLNENFMPTTLSFDKVSFTVDGRRILNDVFGVVKPSECLAIMGGSGAGKTTLLDILAGKDKSGEVSGDIRVNGQKLLQKDYKKMVGFVDQEDHLIPTLTVYETVLNSALLRLPRSMSIAQKEARVMEVLVELRIAGIKDHVVGSDFKRGISGGEKRRVSIACELVTSPAILFLDEPTSGLDSYNARNVVESLVKLSRDFNRTVVFTIHQPRSNIVSLFDKLLLLSEGDLIYSGDMIRCNEFFTANGLKCPFGYNIADYLIDLTVDQKKALELSALAAGDPHANFVASSSSGELDTTREWEHYAVHRDEYQHEQEQSKQTESFDQVKLRLSNIYAESHIAVELQTEIAALVASPLAVDLLGQNLRKASIFQQVVILSLRTFKNLYRNPRLLLTHYALSIVVGAFMGYLYYDVSNDISGFQNRLGLFFFVLAFFGFSSLTGLHSFSEERIIFIRERANNYYHPALYYISKILCDVLPLRVLPPVLLISIAYPMVGLTMEHSAFLKTVLVLVLFNLAVAIEMLIVGILLKESGTSTMIAVLVLLLSLLFAGLFINSEDLKVQIKWLEWISVFHYAYEALAINEVKDLILKEKKYGLSIEVPGAVILSTFGFTVSAFWPDISWLGGLAGIFLVLGYVFLYYFTYERR